MLAIDLDQMSLAELKKLRKNVEKAIENFEKRRKLAALAAAESAVKELGFSLAEIVGKSSSRSAKPTLKAVYRHPDDPSRTWTGRGRRPGWLSDALATGKSLDDFRID